MVDDRLGSGNERDHPEPLLQRALTWVKENHTYKFGSEFRIEGYPPVVDGNTAGVYNFAANETGQPFQNPAVAGSNVGFGYASFLLGLVDSAEHQPPDQSPHGKEAVRNLRPGFLEGDAQAHVRLRPALRLLDLLAGGVRARSGVLPTTPNPAWAAYSGAAIYDGSGPGHCNCNIAHNYPLRLRAAAGRRLSDQLQDRVPRRLRHRLRRHGGQQQRRWRIGRIVRQPIPRRASASRYDFGRRLPGFRLPAAVAELTARASSRPPRPFRDPVPVHTWIRTPAGRRRQYQWSIGFQREIIPNMVVEASYVGNRGVWWQAPALLNLNAITPARLQAFGLDINNPADRTLLTSANGQRGRRGARIQNPVSRLPAPARLLAPGLAALPAVHAPFPSIGIRWARAGTTRCR